MNINQTKPTLKFCGSCSKERLFLFAVGSKPLLRLRLNHGAKLASGPGGRVKATPAGRRLKPTALTRPAPPPLLPRSSSRPQGRAVSILNDGNMENSIQMNGGRLTVLAGMRAMPAKVPDPDLSVPERGTAGPRPIGEIMAPIQRIIEHPDRNRLMAEFFRRHW